MPELRPSGRLIRLLRITRILGASLKIFYHFECGRQFENSFPPIYHSLGKDLRTLDNYVGPVSSEVRTSKLEILIACKLEAFGAKFSFAVSNEVLEDLLRLAKVTGPENWSRLVPGIWICTALLKPKAIIEFRKLSNNFIQIGSNSKLKYFQQRSSAGLNLIFHH